NLIHFSQGTDLLIHEVTGTPKDILQETAQFQRITENHTTPEQAGEVFTRVRPKLAVYTHILLFGDTTPDDLIPRTRENYSGALAVGEDLMAIEVGEKVEARRFGR
ncbi:MAG: MBL fold metallo-hydrolase, partial [Candidatus Binatia bacterium]|nr:MBL fold metallo-hydrolase [Candidatus Binatia bacterium]